MEREEQIELSVSRKKGIKITAIINKIEHRKKIEIVKAKPQFLDKINKIDKPLAGIVREKGQ